jgi:hypothetical protein
MYKPIVEKVRIGSVQKLIQPAKVVRNFVVILPPNYSKIVSAQFLHSKTRSFLHRTVLEFQSVIFGLYTLSTGPITTTNLYIRRTLIKGAYIK